MTGATPSRQEAIRQTLEQRGPMRYSDLRRSQNVEDIHGALKAMIEDGIVFRDSGFYRLASQEIPAGVLPPRTVVVMPSAKDIQRIKLFEREAMKQELEKVRLTLIDIRAYLAEVVQILTPEEDKEP